MRRGAKWRIAGALAVSLLLAGCAGIPMSGPVQQGQASLEEADQTWQNLPSGPSPGASQSDIVRGFVEAASSGSDDYGIAREFLTPDYAGQWDPYFGVLIDAGNRPYQADGEEAGVLSLSAVATVDSHGSMLPVKPGATTDMRFEFDRVGGEWRIASAPAGLILDGTTFVSNWTSRQLYFVGPGDVLVPDTRWFMNRSTLPSAIVGALLEGPAEWLRGSVHSGFPSGTELVANSVPVVNGRAQVDLTDAVLEAGPQALTELHQQLTTSLQSVSDVSEVELLVNGVHLEGVDEGAASGPALVTDTHDPAVLLTDGDFGSFRAGRFQQMPGFVDDLAALNPKAVNLSADQSALAVRGAGGVSRITADGAAVIDDREGLIDPVYDRFGYVWSFSVADPGEVRITAPDGMQTVFVSRLLSGRDIVAIRVSPEGARLAALVRGENGSQVLFTGVVRDTSGVPVRDGDISNVELWAGGDPIDIDWMGTHQFVALTEASGGGAVTLGGPGKLWSTQGSTVPEGRKISGGGVRSQLRVLGGSDDLYVSQGSGWQRAEDDVKVLAKWG